MVWTKHLSVHTVVGLMMRQVSQFDFFGTQFAVHVDVPLSCLVQNAVAVNHQCAGAVGLVLVAVVGSEGGVTTQLGEAAGHAAFDALELHVEAYLRFGEGVDRATQGAVCVQTMLTTQCGKSLFVKLKRTERPLTE